MPIFTKNAQKGVDEDIEEQINTFEITFMCSLLQHSKGYSCSFAVEQDET